MLTLSTALRRAAQMYGSRTAVVLDRDRSLNWTDWCHQLARTASVIAARGLSVGDRFAVIARNNEPHYRLLHAGYWGARVPVSVNNRLAPPEVDHILTDSGAQLLFIEDCFLPLLDAPGFSIWRDRTIVIGDPGQTGLPALEDLIADAAPMDLVDADEQDDAILLYTGGTTGRSKGVRLTHRNVVANGLQVAATCKYDADDIYLHIAPMFHSADLLGTGVTLLGGGHAFLPVFSGDAMLKAFQDTRATATMMAPTMLIMTLTECDIAQYDLSSLRYFLYGSSPMAVEWIRKVVDAFPGVQIVQGYGLTETSPILTILGMQEHLDALESGDHTRLKAAGQPMASIDMRILDAEGRDCPPGEPGEVLVRGPNVSPGYWNLPAINAETFRDGFFRTGDWGRMDAEGYLYLLDRKKDMIISGGENIYSSEVEAAIYQHPGVQECAVVGVPDSRYGEALFAVIVPAEGQTLTAEEMIEHCRARIGGYKIPRRYDFVDALPKSAMGKILKTDLRDKYST